MTEASRAPSEVIHDHLLKRWSGETDADVTTNYAEDVILLSSFGVFRGHDGIRQSAARLAEDISEAQFAYKHTLIESEYGFLEWTAESRSRAIRDGCDSFVVRDGLIVMQTVHYTVVEK